MDVVCLDNFLTGCRTNLKEMQCNPAFELVEADIVNPLPSSLSRRKFDEVYNLACAASPPSHQDDPEHTLMTSVVGTQNRLALDERGGADFHSASTSGVCGVPQLPTIRADHLDTDNPTTNERPY